MENHVRLGRVNEILLHPRRIIPSFLEQFVANCLVIGLVWRELGDPQEVAVLPLVEGTFQLKYTYQLKRNNARARNLLQ